MCECSQCSERTETNDIDGLDICLSCRLELGIIVENRS